MIIYQLANTFDTIVLGIFGPNYLLFFATMLLTIAFIIFSYRYTGPEAILVVNVLSFALFYSGINPLFTSILATVLLVDALFVVLFIWRQLANG